MGYYSEVAFAIRGKKEHVIPMLVTYRNKGKIENDALNECTYREYEGVVTILYHEESIKWYEDFEEVKALNDLYAFFKDIDDDPERDEEFEGRFIRIGEEAEDVREAEFGAEPWDMLGYSRLIDINVSNTPADTLEKLCATPTLPTSSPS